MNLYLYEFQGFPDGFHVDLECVVVFQCIQSLVEGFRSDWPVITDIDKSLQKVLKVYDTGGEGQLPLSIDLFLPFEARPGVVQVDRDDVGGSERFYVVKGIVGAIPMKAVEDKAHVSCSNGANQFFPFFHRADKWITATNEQGAHAEIFKA